MSGTPHPNDVLDPIEPMPEPWQPNPNPESIVIPGLDTTAPVQDQIEQIEQLITIQLQKLDANFAKLNNIMSTRILPAFKRYAVNTEPVRQAAEFWVTFYEQAAQIRIPTSEDYEEHTQSEDPIQQPSSSTESSSSHDIHPQESESDTTTDSNSSIVPPQSDSSFLQNQPGNLVASTPLALSRLGHSSNQEGSSATPSFAISLESPLERLDREIRELKVGDEKQAEASHDTSATPSFSPMHRSYVTGDLPPPESSGSGDDTIRSNRQPVFSAFSKDDKGKSRAQPTNSNSSLLQNVLLQNFQAQASAGAGSKSKTPLVKTSPLKIKPKTPKRLVPEHVRANEWDGIVDLKKSTSHQQKQKSSGRRLDESDSSSDSDDDNMGLPPGMSPPITMDFARKVCAFEPRLVKSPIKETAARRIGENLIGQAARNRYGGESSQSQSSVPSIPSLSRYMDALESDSQSLTQDASIESMMRRIEKSIPRVGIAPPSNRLRDDSLLGGGGVPANDSDMDDSFGDTMTPGRGVFAPANTDLHDDDGAGSSDSSGESFLGGNTAVPSAAFLLASQRERERAGADGSFGSDDNVSSDSLSGEDDGTVARQAIHPFAQPGGGVVDDSFDDSFDDDIPAHHGPQRRGEVRDTDTGVQSEATSTFFGVRAGAQVGQARPELRLLGQELLDDTIGIGAQLATRGYVEGTPTPAPWQLASDLDNARGSRQ